MKTLQYSDVMPFGKYKGKSIEDLLAKAKFRYKEGYATNDEAKYFYWFNKNVTTHTLPEGLIYQLKKAISESPVKESIGGGVFDKYSSMDDNQDIYNCYDPYY
jgi:uncharacterized protein (DUF3820 family)